MSIPHPQVTKQRRRSGMTVVVVLGVISITLALSYAMLRSQVTSVEIQSNLDRRNSARQAAYAGISAALRAMHNANWSGVDSTMHQDLTEFQCFEVSYETGDASLEPTDSDYSEFPFRVTINSKGYAYDPSQPDVHATHRVQAVVELVRRKLNDTPANWATIKNYVGYQWSGTQIMAEFPVHVEGPMFAQGTITLSSDYPIDALSRSRYLSDLKAMKSGGLGDHRPFSGPITTPFSKQLAATLTLLGTDQGVTMYDTAINTAAPLSYPASGNMCYQLFPGGKCYELPNIQTTHGNSPSGMTLSADVQTNPLGIFLSTGTLTLNQNCTINGTIVTQGTEPDIKLNSTNITWQAPNLPLLEGSTAIYQLPAAIVKDDFYVAGTAGATIRGAVTVWDDFSFQRGDSAAACDIKGRVVAAKFNLLGRAPWDLSLANWQSEYLAFTTQAVLPGGEIYYPRWLQTRRTFNYQPKLTIAADSAEINHHWHVFGQPIYVAHPDDPGLQWNLVGWKDSVRE